jgi:hypothetical protein
MPSSKIVKDPSSLMPGCIRGTFDINDYNQEPGTRNQEL